MRNKSSFRRLSMAVAALAIAASVMLTGCGGSDGGGSNGGGNNGGGSNGGNGTVTQPEDPNQGGNNKNDKITLNVKEVLDESEAYLIDAENYLVLDVFTVSNPSDKDVKLSDYGFVDYQKLMAKYQNNPMGMLDDASVTGSGFKAQLQNGEFKKCVAAYTGEDTLKAKESKEIDVVTFAKKGFTAAVISYNGAQVGTVRENATPKTASGVYGDELTIQGFTATLKEVQHEADTYVYTAKLTVKNTGDADYKIDNSKLYLGFYTIENGKMTDYFAIAAKTLSVRNSSIAPGETVEVTAEFDVQNTIEQIGQSNPTLAGQIKEAKTYVIFAPYGIQQSKASGMVWFETAIQ